MRLQVSFALALFFSVHTVLCADDAPSDPLTEAAASITEAELRNYVNFLASDTLEGREAGTHGGYAAAAFITQELRKLEAVKPAGQDNDFFQYFHPNYRNILATIPGSDPQLKDEYILIGAHYDHVGYGNRNNSRGTIGIIHNGADDNASGTSGILEVAEAIASMETRPKRSILIALWDGEEEGLLGSKFHVSSPVVPLKRIRLHINVDMIGRLRPESFEVFGWRTAPGLRRWLTDHNDGLHVKFTYDYLADSDHWPFYQQGVPSLMLHTGKHDDYHTAKDDAPKVNFEGLQRVSQYLFRLVLDAASADTLPKFRNQSWHELQTLAQLPERIPDQTLPSRLGLKFDSELSQDGVVRLTEIEQDGPAHAAGLRAGDEILEFAGRRVSEETDFRLLVAAAVSPVAVHVFRDEEELDFQVRLRGNRMEWGFQFRRDSAEPDSVVVTAIFTGSPAAIAGLKRGDRIRSLDGKPVREPVSFRRLLRESAGPLPVRIERNGQLLTLTLQRVVLDQ